MELVADGRLASIVSQAGGFGLIGGGYGDATWLKREIEVAAIARGVLVSLLGVWQKNLNY